MLKIPDADLPVWRNGRWLNASEAVILPWQPSAAAGWGVFETLAVWDGVPLELEGHLSRLGVGIQRLGGGTSPTEPWSEACVEWSRRMAGDGWLKILWGCPGGLHDLRRASREGDRCRRSTGADAAVAEATTRPVHRL